ncbi:MAG: SpoIVB peptidase S55 domain-containing protein [Peptostreptococcaceae bacterium]
MKLLKSLILSLIAIIILNLSFVFCEDGVNMIPSGDVVVLSFELKHPYVQQKLSDKGTTTLQLEDVILSIKSDKVNARTLKQIYKLMKLPEGNLQVEFIHEGKIKVKDITTDELRMYKFEDTIYGIGTITGIDKNGKFIGVAHSIELNKSNINMKKGSIHEVSYIQEIKSQNGKVGNLVTSLTGKVKGKIISTNEYGIKGKYNKFYYNKEKALKVGNPQEGKAYIYCKTPVSNKLRLHQIEIIKVGKNESEIVIKDKDLIKYRGGGVRGMSGSPIIQDGKLIGGFCSVLRKEPTKGFITNIDKMLTNN